MDNTDVAKQIKFYIHAALNKCGLSINSDKLQIEHPADKQFGDWSSNVAMMLAKEVKKNPRVVAEEITTKLPEEQGFKDIVEKVEIAGAGFINFYLNPDWLSKQAEIINYDNEWSERIKIYGQGKTMVIDYSAPNIAKPFGIGHLRSTNIGQAIYNLYKVLGWNCVGDNHLGDWGTQFGKLMVALTRWNKKKLEELTIDDLEKLYVKFHSESENIPELEDEAREWFAKLEANDPEAKNMWQSCIDISLVEFNKVYEMLGVKIDYALGESFYQDKMEAVLDLMKQRKLLKQSEGALIVEFDNMPPAIVVKSNGTTTYFLRDLATIKYRIENWNPDLIVYEVGADQELYFRQVFAAAKNLGWDKNYYHVAHGMIRWADGKFSTRQGKTIHLSDVIDKAVEEAEKIAPKNDRQKILDTAIGAIKFNDLSSDPKKDIIFDWERVMSMDGDSGPYLQYTYARCQSVLNKTEVIEQKNYDQGWNEANADEIGLIREFYKFEEKIIESATRFSPSVLAEYLLQIARLYNEFYAKNRIIGQKEEVRRIFLTKVTSSILKKGMVILGINPIEQM